MLLTGINLAGRDLTNYMTEMLSTEQGISLHKTFESESIVRDLKEELTYIALDFDEEMKKDDFEKDYELPDGKVCTLIYKYENLFNS